MIRARVVGGAELSRKFRKLEKAVQSRILEAALISGALVIQNEWKIRAPHNVNSPPVKNPPSRSTGNYRRSIHIGGHTELAPDFQGSDIGAQEADLGRARVIVGTNLVDPPYPVFLEEGTSKMSARPSAGPAFDAKKDEAVREIGEAFREIVSKLA